VTTDKRDLSFRGAWERGRLFQYDHVDPGELAKLAGMRGVPQGGLTQATESPLNPERFTPSCCTCVYQNAQGVRSLPGYRTPYPCP
jgi:hypothetical protein